MKVTGNIKDVTAVVPEVKKIIDSLVHERAETNKEGESEVDGKWVQLLQLVETICTRMRILPAKCKLMNLVIFQASASNRYEKGVIKYRRYFVIERSDILHMHIAVLVIEKSN